jgi:hypothetical protein
VAHDFFKVNGKSVFNVMMEKTLKHQGKPSGDRTLLVSKNGLFEPFMYKNEHFTKTGSGQT